MSIAEVDSFVKKFHQLRCAGFSAHLDLEAHAGRAWVGLRVQLGHAPGYLHQNFPDRKRDSPSRQRRRARRAAAQQEKAEEAVKEETGKKTTDTTAEKAGDSLTTVIEQSEKDSEVNHANTAEEVKSMIVTDEVCKDDDYEVKEEQNSEPKSICSVDIYPLKYNLDRLESFRCRIKEYFEKRKDVIGRVISCDVVNHGNNVRLVAELKVKRGWIFFFADPEENYPDLYKEAIRTIRHSCQDLSNCGG